MRKILLFVIICIILSSCYVLTQPAPRIPIGPKYRKLHWKNWYGVRYHLRYPERYRYRCNKPLP